MWRHRPSSSETTTAEKARACLIEGPPHVAPLSFQKNQTEFKLKSKSNSKSNWNQNQIRTKGNSNKLLYGINMSSKSYHKLNHNEIQIQIENEIISKSIKKSLVNMRIEQHLKFIITVFFSLFI